MTVAGEAVPRSPKRPQAGRLPRARLSNSRAAVDERLVRLPDAFEFVAWHGFLDNEVAGFQKFVAVEFHVGLQSG